MKTKMPTVKKEYLGDSVYVAQVCDGASLVLTTENGLPSDPSSEIIFELETFEALLRYAQRNGWITQREPEYRA